MHWFRLIIESIFSIALFINAALFIPQALKILKTRSSKDVSLVTFAGFCFIQIATIAYGFLKGDMILIVGYLLSLLACGLVVILILTYR